MQNRNSNEENPVEKNEQGPENNEEKKSNEIDAVPFHSAQQAQSPNAEPPRKKHFSNNPNNNRKPFNKGRHERGNRSDQGNPGNQRSAPSDANSYQNPQGHSPYSESYVSMGERYQKQRSGYGADYNYGTEGQTEEERENFGNSIHYQGPGVDVRFGTARDEGPQFAPWEGAHGFLLTHHEAKKPRQNNGGGKSNQGRRNDRGRSQQPGQSAQQGQAGSQGQPGNQGASQRNFKKKNRHKKPRGQLHDIVCVECQVETQVPFKPIPGKPVYCKECHKKLLEKSRAEKLQKAEDGQKPATEESSSAAVHTPVVDENLS